jgi:3-deoxy-D-manno-octulosonic-acid transferase
MPNTPSATPAYILATTLLFPFAVLFTGVVAIRHRNLKYFAQRLGLFHASKSSHQPIWLHCASVGEVNTALPLIQALSHKNNHLLISTSTITGQICLQKARLKKTELIFLPLDYPFFARQLIKKYQPKIFLIFETELWPNIILTVQRQMIPCAIINARISEKTLNAPTFIKRNYARLLANIEKIYVGSSHDIDKFISLGAQEDQIIMQDNLKFSASLNTHEHSENPFALPFILCASTREGEEQKIISQWMRLNKKGCALVIAPRHPDRIKKIIKLIKNHKLKYTLHSKANHRVSLDSIYLIDTLGDLAPFMMHAHLVFVGGSLTANGGHNVLEPASLGKCILVGPHTQNITQIVNELSKHQAIQIVNDETEFADAIIDLLDNHIKRTQMEENARNFVKSKQHVLSDYIEAISNFIQIHSS